MKRLSPLRLSAALTAALAGTFHPPGVAEGYDCDVHATRPIRLDASQPEPVSTSYRELCRDIAKLDTGERPVCVCNNTGEVLSDPALTTCPQGYTKIGACRVSRHHNQTCSIDCGACSGTCSTVCPTGTCEGGCGALGAYCPDSAYTNFAFVPEAAACGPAGHDPRSAVEGCKVLCDTYFANRYFDRSPQNPAGHQYGSWRIGTPPSGSGIPTLGAWQAAGSIAPTALAECRRKCGPPDDGGGPAPYGSPPGDNNWRYVTFERRDPNVHLDRWLRSYAVNVPDRPDPPKKNCEELVADYCTNAPLDNGQPLTVNPRARCKKNLMLFLELLPAEYTGPVDFIAGTVFDFSYPRAATPNFNDDGFCDHFALGHVLAYGTCYERDNGGANPQHYCGDSSCSPDGTIGGDCKGCSPETATCTGEAPLLITPFHTVSAFLPFQSKPPTCGPTLTETASAVPVFALYTGPSADVVSAKWENLTTGEKGDMIFSSNSWRTAVGPRGPEVAVSLAAGPNTIRVRFTDDRLRVSGDALEVERQ